MKKVTAVLPARNCRQELFKCLSALSRGNYVPEMIVVDDGSDDGTREMIRKYRPSVTYLPLPAHTGYAHAANAGLRLVRTEYAFLIRPDLMAGKKCIERLLEAMDREDIFCAVPEILTAGSSRHRKNRPAPETIAVPDGCAMYRMRTLEEIGWLDERHFDGLEAFDLSLRAFLRGWRTAEVQGARVQPGSVGRRAGKSATGSKTGEKGMFRRQLAAGNMIYVLYKNIPWPVRVPALPLYAAADAVQIASFIKHGEFDAYKMAVERGRALCSMEKEKRAALQNGAGIWPENLSDASFLGMDESAEKIYPLFLAEKEPLSLKHLGRYMQIQGMLAAGFPKIIRLFL